MHELDARAKTAPIRSGRVVRTGIVMGRQPVSVDGAHRAEFRLNLLGRLGLHENASDQDADDTSVR
jgi:hypothetical protein